MPGLEEATPSEVLEQLGSGTQGISEQEASRRLEQFGQNALPARKFTVWDSLRNQAKNPILVLLAVAALASGLLGDPANATVIGVILTLSVALSVSTEFRAERASADLQARSSRSATVIREGIARQIEAKLLVTGDVVRLGLGSVVPADLRLLEGLDLECDESVITGESMPVTKDAGSKEASSNRLLMGSVIRAGSGTGIVVATGESTEFGKIAQGLNRAAPETDFQRGLRKFSIFLLGIAVVQAVLVVSAGIFLGRNLAESVLFALALAVGMTPQLLPAVVSTSLAIGSKFLEKNGVLVKRLVSIEDLGDLDILITDKTGTLTLGAIGFETAINYSNDNVIGLGLLATDADYQQARVSAAGLNPIDAALWQSQGSIFPSDATRLDSLAFDHSRRISSALVVQVDGETLVSKGSPEDIFARCSAVSSTARDELSKLYAQGKRVIAVAAKPMPGSRSISSMDESNLQLQGFLVFSDPLKGDTGDSLKMLSSLGIEVKIATGDSAQVTESVCRAVGLEVSGILTGEQIDKLGDAELAAAASQSSIFARVSPEQKARIIRSLRNQGKSIGFLGDGVNDAIALHDADVGISVDTGTDVAKDAADIVLLKKDLGTLGIGVRRGRQVFNNTMKYILMGTAGDFGNLVSAGIGSAILPFLPMAPSQVLLQDLLYDSSQLAIPVDNVDAEQTARPSHWRISFIARFMVVFGLISTVFDFATFAIMANVFHARAEEFQTGWFVESLSTAVLVVLSVRTRRVPFLRSRPAPALILSVIGVVGLGISLTYLPFGGLLGFTPLPAPFFFVLTILIIGYLALVELAKLLLFQRMNRI